MDLNMLDLDVEKEGKERDLLRTYLPEAASESSAASKASRWSFLRETRGDIDSRPL